MSLTLQLTDVQAGYTPGVDILQGLSMQVQPGAMTVIIGPNGAGKSTTLKTIFGFLHPKQGAIHFLDQRIDTLDPYQIKNLGVSYIPQAINVFRQLTVEENLKMGGWVFRKDKIRLQNQLERIYTLFPILKEFRKRQANQLSGGQAKMLSIAKEVISEPQLILVDEPTAALAPLIAQETYDFLLATQKALNAAIILVDHNMEKAAELADYVYVLSLGQMIEEGPGSAFDVERLRDIIRQCLLAN